MERTHNFTHLDDKGQKAQMVDIASKKETERFAHARCEMVLSKKIIKSALGGDILTPKGAVFQTAILAATQAVKRTHELIPLCHMIPIEDIKINIQLDERRGSLIIDSKVKSHYKTGVEMEALMGASLCALTIYDMCKSIDHDMTIKRTELVEKKGGMSTKEKTEFELRPVIGLVLAGGRSKRMGEDKSSIPYYGKPHWEYLYDELTKVCDYTYVSKGIQLDLASLTHTNGKKVPLLFDEFLEVGPLGGILTALKKHRNADILVVACDLPFVSSETFKALLSGAHEESSIKNYMATCFYNEEKGWSEPLCTLYNPKAYEVLMDAMATGLHCPRKIIEGGSVKKLTPKKSSWLMNANTLSERKWVEKEILQ